MPKRAIAKVIQISDIVNWYDKGEIDISPKYQRNNVWNDKAKAYLIDTIVRGLPIPPIFIRQTVDVVTKKAFREIIDGQQRIRAIIEYVIQEKFAIKSSHNKEFGGMKYSNLSIDVQEDILQYEIVAEIVLEKDDSIVYDMFARLNTNNVVLNKQEIRNAKYWGDFKVFINKVSTTYREFFSDNRILSSVELSRMKDAELISSLTIILTEGICEETPKYVDSIYQKYDKDFNNSDKVEEEFSKIMDVILKIFKKFLGNETCFENKNYFYTLFAVIANQMYGIPGDYVRNPHYEADNINKNLDEMSDKFVNFVNDYSRAIVDKDNKFGLFFEFEEFTKNHKYHTTSRVERCKRVKFLNDYIGCDNYAVE